MTFMAHAVEFVVVAGLLGLLAAGVAFLLVRSYLRRHWRLMQGHVATRGVLAGLAVLAAGRDRYVARMSSADLSRGSASRVRRRMWVAVEDAESAVAHSAAHGAPVAELPAVCRSLRNVAGELDGLLRMERRLPAGTARTDTVRQQVAEVIDAARSVQAAVLGAGSDAAEPQLRALVRQARDEVDIVSAALARVRSLARPN